MKDILMVILIAPVILVLYVFIGNGIDDDITIDEMY